MNARVQRMCVWSVLLGFLLIFLALLVAGWFPLPAAHHTAAYIGLYHRDHPDAIRLGAVFMTAGAALLLFPSLLCVWIKRGAFAWNGVASLYLAFVAVGAWFGAMVWQLLRVVAEQERATALR